MGEAEKTKRYFKHRSLKSIVLKHRERHLEAKGLSAEKLEEERNARASLLDKHGSLSAGRAALSL